LNNKVIFELEVINVNEDAQNENQIVTLLDLRSGELKTLLAKKVIACTNRRLGKIREIQFHGESIFKGIIEQSVWTMNKQLSTRDFKGRRVVIIGGGAFACENARTAIEWGAAKVIIVCKRRTAVMPQIIDYLNFIRPLCSDFGPIGRGSARAFAAWVNSFEICSVTKPECWQEGRVTPVGHSVSVQDLWLVAHYYGVLETVLGTVREILDNSVALSTGETIQCDIILKCTGFEKMKVWVNC
jgi:hypothetical protein